MSLAIGVLGLGARRAVIEDARRRQRKRRRWTAGAAVGVAFALWMVLPGHPWRPGVFRSAPASVARHQRSVQPAAGRGSTCAPGRRKVPVAQLYESASPRTARLTASQVLESLTPLVHMCVFVGTR
jgi:hypothetical protein